MNLPRFSICLIPAVLTGCLDSAPLLVLDVPPDTLWDTLPVEPRQTTRRPGPTFLDARNGYAYRTDTIGDMVWMAENLRLEPADRTARSCPGGTEQGCTDHGYLYLWRAAMARDTTVDNWCDLSLDPTGICPTGWHIPSRQEWERLLLLLGGGAGAGRILKSETGWKMYLDLSARGIDSVGFDARPAGFATGDLAVGLGTDAGFWSRTDTSTSNYNSCLSAWSVFLNADSKNVRILSVPRRTALSVRCLRNSTQP